MLIFKLSCLEKVLLPKFGGLTLNISEPLFFDDVRESSFNMTRGGGGGRGDEDIETRSLKFL